MQDPARIFEGKVVLVTGAASGIGKCIATEFAKKGADVALNDIARAQLAKTCQEIKRVGVTAKQFVFDVSDGKEVRRSIDEVERMMGKIDILVNNAGIATGTDFLEMNDKEWDKILSINLKGAFLVTQAVIRSMIRRRYGRVVMVASIAGKSGGVATSVAYDVSKAGMIVMAKSLARRYGKYGLTINSVAPSFANTKMLNDLKLASSKKEIAKMNVIQRLAEPEDVANAVLFLASDSSSFITGETMNVNGGRLMD